MTEEELNLLKFASGCSTQASACPPQVMRRELIVADSLGEFFNYMPNQLLGHAFAQGLPALLTFLKSFPVVMAAASIQSRDAL
jgi:hypothetical protein